jgi:Carbohydrate binding domain
MALTQVDQGLLSSTAQYTGFKNRIINGAMNVWQRGTSFSTGGIYCGDRWFSYFGTFNQSTDAPTAFAYSAALTASGSGANIQQRIEAANCADLSGQSVTISFWAKSVSGSTTVNFGINYANSADNFSGSTGIGSQNVTITTSWVQYTTTFTNLPSGVKNGVLLFIGNPSGAAAFNITGVQLEKGSTATSFDYRPYGTELALCQRYYTPIGGNLVGMLNGSGTATGFAYLPVTPRATPSVSYTGTAQIIVFGVGTYSSTTQPSGISLAGNNLLFAINGFGATPTTGSGQLANTIYTASMEL